VYRGALAERCFRFYVSPLALLTAISSWQRATRQGDTASCWGFFRPWVAAGSCHPVATSFIFNRKGLPDPVSVAEMNAKLKAVLSAECFLAACLIDIDPAVGDWRSGVVVCRA